MNHRPRGRRWRWFALAAAFTIAACACESSTRQSTAADAGSKRDAARFVSDASSLTLQWIGPTQGAMRSSPVVARGVVYAGSDDGRVYAFDAAGGVGCNGSPSACAPRWSFATGGPVTTSPAVAGATVYVTSNDHNLYALDAAGTTRCSGQPRTCAPLWSAPLGSAAPFAPVVAGGVVYAASNDHEVHAFDAAGSKQCGGQPRTCAPLWSGHTDGAITSSPVASGGVLYVSSDNGEVAAFDASGHDRCAGTPSGKTCAPRWVARAGNAITSAPAIAYGRLYVGGERGVFAFDAAGVTNCAKTSAVKVCRPVWSGTTGGPIAAAPAAAGGVVYAGSLDAKLYAFDATANRNCTGRPRTCTPLWTATTGGPISSRPAVTTAAVYSGSADQNVYAFDTKTGALQWTATTGGAVNTSPATGDGGLLAGSDDGNLYAFGPSQLVRCASVSDPTLANTTSASPRPAVPLQAGIATPNLWNVQRSAGRVSQCFSTAASGQAPGLVTTFNLTGLSPISNGPAGYPEIAYGFSNDGDRLCADTRPCAAAPFPIPVRNFLAGPTTATLAYSLGAPAPSALPVDLIYNLWIRQSPARGAPQACDVEVVVYLYGSNLPPPPPARSGSCAVAPTNLSDRLVMNGTVDGTNAPIDWNVSVGAGGTDATTVYFVMTSPEPKASARLGVPLGDFVKKAADLLGPVYAATSGYVMGVELGAEFNQAQCANACVMSSSDAQWSWTVSNFSLEAAGNKLNVIGLS